MIEYYLISNNISITEIAIGVQTSVDVIIARQLDGLLTCTTHIIQTEKIEILKITKSMPNIHLQILLAFLTVNRSNILVSSNRRI